MPPKKSKSVDFDAKSKPRITRNSKKQEEDDEPLEKPEKKQQGNTEEKPKKQVQKKLKLVNLKDGMIVEGGQGVKLKVEYGEGKFENKIINIGSWNINGLRAVIDRPDFQSYFKNPIMDVICLNETKIDEDTYLKQNLQAKFPKEYFQYINCSKPPKTGYSGVAIFTKVKPISVQFDIGHVKHDAEGRTLTLEFEKFFLVSCYVPNSSHGLVRLDYRTKEWDIDFRQYLATLKAKKPTILCGDLNVAHHEIDIANPKGNLKSAGFTIEERDSFTKFLSEGWVDTFRVQHPEEVKYSYFSARTKARESGKGWRLDYFIIDEKHKDAVITSDINNTVYGSDHTPVEISLDLSKL